MPMKWDQAADAQLLTAILKCHNFKLDHFAIAKEMGHDLTDIAIKRRIDRIKAIGADNLTSSPQSTPNTKKQDVIKNGFTAVNSSKAKKAGSGGKKNADGHGLASDANDADDDCTPSATGNNSETGTATAAATAAAARAIAIEANEGDAAGVTKPGASKPPSITTGKASTRGGKGGRAGNSSSSSSTRGKRAGGAAGTKRKVPSASAGSAADAASGSTGSVPKTNAKTKKSVKAAGPRPAQPVSSNFCFFDEPIEELVEPAAGAKDGAGDEDGDGEVAGGVVNVKAEVDDDNDAVDNGGGGADGGDANEEDTNVVNDDGDDDYDDDDALQKESPGRKKVKLEAGNAANEDGDEMAGVVASV